MFQDSNIDMDVGVMSVDEDSMGQHAVAFDQFNDFNGTQDPVPPPHDKSRDSHSRTSRQRKRLSNNVPTGVMYLSMDGSRAPPSRTNSMESNRGIPIPDSPRYPKRSLGRDAQNLLDYFRKMQSENPGFYYAIQLDEDNRMGNVFWADSRSRTAYSHFGDSVTLDTLYKVKQFKVPFAPFTGVNHHGQTILFGCALLLDDSECTFTWLFKTFLTAMNNRAPLSITTDPDKPIQDAVAHVFQGTRHCVNKWHVLREGQERLSHVCNIHPNFQIELYNCINNTETIPEFESAWSFLLDRYDLRRHDWLQLLYSVRHQWVPAFFRDTFFGFIHVYETSFFDGYVTEHTTVPMFFRQYERALENSFEKEIESDFDTISTTPILRTPSPMEKQAASLYTKTIFSKFQEELVETFVYTANRIDGDNDVSTFRVAKFEDDKKSYLVSLNVCELRASCSCQMFEYSGILCRHILTVFTVTNVLTLPSHYIMKRWTRNAKNTNLLESLTTTTTTNNESLNVRYNFLLREAVKFAEEGAVAVDTFTVAVAALRDGGRKVAAAKANVASFAPGNVSVVGYDNRKAGSTSDMSMTPLLWPRQDEVTRRFNLNDGGVGLLGPPIADLNLPRMAPVSLRRDDSHHDNMVILPCLKSMTWVMENKTLPPANRVAVINLKLQDYRKTPGSESEVKFQLSTVTLEPMLRSMAYINEQLSSPANRVAVINLKLQDTDTSSGESEVKFQVSRDTLGAMLRSMAYIREQLSNAAESASEIPAKRSRK